MEMPDAAGYRYIGMDHFALPGDELVRVRTDNGTLQRNFGATPRTATATSSASGMSAISHIGDSYSQNTKDLVGYYRPRPRPPAHRARPAPER